MTGLELTALRGDDPLGFLAALGVLRLTAHELGDDTATLSWPGGPWNAANIECAVATSVTELATAIFAVVDSTRANDQLVPEVEGYPQRAETKSTPDPMNRRLSWRDGRGLAGTALQSGEPMARWLRGTVSTSGVVEHMDDKTTVALEPSPLYDVGPGTVKMAGTLAKALAAVADARVLRSAMLRWERSATVGAYLDHRADRPKVAGQDPRRDLAKYGEPGATWLALMATPLFDIRGSDRGAAETVAWYRRPRRFCWPVWSQRLDADGVVALLDHPQVRRVGASREPQDDQLRNLGVSAIFRTDRLMAGNYAAALGPPVQLWP